MFLCYVIRYPLLHATVCYPLRANPTIFYCYQPNACSLQSPLCILPVPRSWCSTPTQHSGIFCRLCNIRQKIRSPRYVIAHVWRDNWGYLNEWLVARAILGRLPSYCCFIFSSFEMSATSGVTVTVINPLVTSMAGGGSSGSGGSSSSSLATATWRRMLNWTVSPT